MNLKYKIPFGSLKSKEYEIEIYDSEYVGSPIVLTAGETPFVTDEDSSEDVFTPIRTQTGTIQVVNQYKEGGVTKFVMEELQPLSNISNPVLLVRYYDNEGVRTRVVEWQGFLSCEAYEQSYIQTPQYFEICVNGMFEAMKSIYISDSEMNGRIEIRKLLAIALRKLQDNGVLHISNIYIPSRSRNILDEFIETYFLFDIKSETISSKQFDYKIEKPSAYNILDMVSGYMGWCIREFGENIYMQIIGVTSTFDEYTSLSSFENKGAKNIVSKSDIDILENDWRGIEHNVSIQRGVRSVSVNNSSSNNEYSILKLSNDFYLRRNYDLSSEKEITPPSAATSIGFYLDIKRPTNGDDGFVKYHCYETYNNAMRFDTQEISSQNALEYFYENYEIRTKHLKEMTGSVYAMLCACSYHDYDESKTAYTRGLLVGMSGNQFPYNSDKYVFSMKNPCRYKFVDGYLKLKLSLGSLEVAMTQGEEKIEILNDRCYFSIRIGDYYVNLNDDISLRPSMILNQWSDDVYMVKDYGYIVIPISYLCNSIGIDYLEGDIELYFHSQDPYFYTESMSQKAFYLLNSIELSYVEADGGMFSDAHKSYIKMLDLNFDEDISLDVRLTTMFDTVPNPSILLNHATGLDFMTDYYLSAGTLRKVIPEEDLVKRMAEYYKKSRKIITIVIDRNDGVDYPLVRYNNTIEGNKKYLPISESKDWANDISTVKCIEETNITYSPIINN